MLIQHNMLATNAFNRNKINEKKQSKYSEKLSSGYRINRAADDAASLQISEKLRTQIRGLDQADENIEDGISLIKTADGAMGEIENMLHRLKELGVQAANDTYTENDRNAIQKEIDELKEQIDQIANDTEFNTIHILNNSWKNPASTLSGLAYILGDGFITTSPYLGDTLVIGSGGGTWVTTGNTAAGTQSYTDYAGGIPPASSPLAGPIAIPSAAAGTTERTDSNGNIIERVTATAGGGSITETWSYLSNGSGALTPPIVNIYKKTEYDNAGTKLNYTIQNITAGGGNPGNAALPGTPLATGFLDFSGLGTKYTLQDLVGRGFNTTCQTCSEHYSIFFVDTGTGHKTSNKGGGNPILEFDVASLPSPPSGADLVQGLMAAISASPLLGRHYTQYAYSTADPTKLYVYDNRTYYTRNDGTGGFVSNATHATFEPTAFGVPNVETPPRKPFYIQAGANEMQHIELKLPWVTTARMGLAATLVTDHESATQSIGLIDDALKFINNERSIMGAYQNRLEHAAQNAKIGSENQQDAESRLRDADMAEMMVEYSKYNILMQSSQAMLAQANEKPQLVLQLLR